VLDEVVGRREIHLLHRRDVAAIVVLPQRIVGIEAERVDADALGLLRQHAGSAGDDKGQRH
jgi:hypothetical protein